MPRTQHIRSFRQYAESLENLLSSLGTTRTGGPARILPALDGEPSEKAKRFLSTETLKKRGAFFTGRTLARRAVRALLKDENRCTQVIDPACGLGDLLLQYARTMPVYPDLRRTLQLWGNRLLGCDMQADFVRVTKARLALLAMQRGAHPATVAREDLDSLLPGVSVSNGLDCPSPSQPLVVIMNPPYTLTTAPDNCSWAAGRVSSAAIFLDKWLTGSPEGSRIVAILPDVLRTGTRYSRWREYVAKHAAINSIRIVGRFDGGADVDVFILDLSVTSPEKPPK